MYHGPLGDATSKTIERQLRVLKTFVANASPAPAMNECYKPRPGQAETLKMKQS
ncbi:hypothetical protein Syun_029250 [Stephania yunnanensis]|uniref:Uncharacterized protein n=1 Tax=Stephania yunnanensis TaxID=152371 RepID=A0AAP0E5A3_9MAGN